MTDIATGRQPRPPDLDKFPAAFPVAGEKQEKAADEGLKKLWFYCNDGQSRR
jgi:hypothetical protein